MFLKDLLRSGLQSRKTAKLKNSSGKGILLVILTVIVVSSNLSFSQYLPVITNGQGDTIQYVWPIPDSLLCIKDEIIIKFRANALHLNKLCYIYQGPPTIGEPENDPAILFKNQLMTEQFPIDTLIADSALCEAIKLFGGIYLTRITAANPCTDTLSITRYGDTVKYDNYLYMKLKLNNDTTMIDACIWLTLLYQYYLQLAQPNFCKNNNRPDPTDIFYQGVNIGETTYEQKSLKSFYSNVRRAWDFQVGIPDIKIGVIDNGIDWIHCDFGRAIGEGHRIGGGYNYIGKNGYIQDQCAHGTMVAGIIGAYTNGPTYGQSICVDEFGIGGVAGIAGGWFNENKSGCTLYGLKTHNGNNHILTSEIISAVDAAAANLLDEIPRPNVIPQPYGVHIINCSFGGLFYDELERSIFNFAYEQGVSIVCSRGNFDYITPNYPATYESNWVTSVGGHDDGIPSNNIRPKRSIFSRYGLEMDLLAPSTSTTIMTTKPYEDDWGGFEFTSAAAPHVTGAIALLRSEFYKNPNHTIPPGLKPEPEDYENMIKAAAFDLNDDPDNENELKRTYIGYDNVSGWGQLKVGEVFEMLDDGYVIEHYTITQMNTDAVYQYIDGGIVVHANGKRRDVPQIAYPQAERREITGTITLNDNWVVDETHNLYVWGRNGRTYKGGFNQSNVLYLTSFTEVTSGEGGNGIVPGIIHNSSLTVNAKTYQYRLNHGIELPLDNNLEMYITVFGKKDVTSVQDKSNQNLVMITPNPANETITINFKTENITTPVIRIYNYLGELVLEEICDAPNIGIIEKALNTSNLSSGIYVLEIIQNTEIKRSKFVIAK